jgi:hypothetical protein
MAPVLLLHPPSVDSTWEGCDEMDETSGEGWADLEKDGSLTGEISYRNGGETSFKARPWRRSGSIPCALYARMSL